MAKDYTPNKLDLSTFHGGKQYENGQAPNVEDFNKLVEGVAHAQENGGGFKLYKHIFTRDDGSQLRLLSFISEKKTMLVMNPDYDGDNEQYINVYVPPQFLFGYWLSDSRVLGMQHAESDTYVVIYQYFNSAASMDFSFVKYEIEEYKGGEI